MFDIKNPNSFLGGQNVHNLIIIGLLIYIIFKLIKKVNNEESGLTRTSFIQCAPGYIEIAPGVCRKSDVR